MQINQTILFFNFPEHSQLKGNILNGAQRSDLISFVSLDKPTDATTFIQANPKTLFIFWATNTSEYIKSKSVLQNVKATNKVPLLSMGVIGNDSDEVLAALKDLGCQHVFDTGATSKGMIPVIDAITEQFLLIQEKNDKLKKVIHGEDDELVVIAKDQKVEPDFERVKRIETPAKKFENNISNFLTAEQVSLDSGELIITFSEPKYGDISCQIDGFEEDTIDLVISSDYQFQAQESIELEVVFKYAKCKVEIVLEGNIFEIENTDKANVNLLSIKLSSNEQFSLDQFMALYAKRQKSINDFMLLAKGC
jgi:hypothetical protein